MTDTFARMRQLIGSTAEWKLNNQVLGYGEIGIERVSATEYKAKVGDGTTGWAALPYLSATPSGINASIQAALDQKLAIAGGTMTGDLILAHPGAKPNEAVTYTQLQNEVTNFTTALAGKLALGGGALTGPVMLAGAATQPLQPVTFDQMNKALAAFSASTSGALVYAGTVDPTIVYAAPTPAPVGGNVYTVAHAGTVHATWHPHLTNATLASVAVGDYLVWNATTSKFDHIKNAVDLTAYVPLAGTAGMIGNIVWSGAAANKKGVSIISGKGGTLDDIVIDEGYF